MQARAVVAYGCLFSGLRYICNTCTQVADRYITLILRKKSKRYFSDNLWKKGIKKIKITQRNRCFGYVDNGIFYVLRVDLDHELSDVG